MEYFTHSGNHESMMEEVVTGGHMAGGWSWAGMAIMWGLFILIALLAIKYLASNSTPKPQGSAPSAAEVLNRRYASGEISKKEYDEIKKAISTK